MCGLLFLAAAAVDLSSVRAVGASLVLMGEEMSVSMRDVVFSVEQRTQATIWSTNFGALPYYWLASHLDPSYSLFSARRWKAAAMAVLAPLVYLVLRRRLGCRRASAVLGAVTVVLLPGVAMFGWLATDNGFETVIGTAGLYLATSRRPAWVAAPVLAGLAVTTYPSGMAWAGAVLVVCAVRSRRAGQRQVLLAATATVVGAAIVVFPLWWWTAGPDRIIAGGGTIDGAPLANLGNLLHQLAVSGESYYFFSDLPALGSGALAAACGVALVAAGVVRPRAAGPWLLVAALTVAMWIPTGNMPGVRRAVALSVVAGLALAVCVDGAARLLADRRGVLAGPVVAVAGVLVCVPLAVSLLHWQSAFREGTHTLVPDFPLTAPMPPALAAYDADLRAGRLSVEQAVNDRDGVRILAAVWLLADRTGRGTAGLPTPEQIVHATVPH
jgi:hypothetical protein